MSPAPAAGYRIRFFPLPVGERVASEASRVRGARCIDSGSESPSPRPSPLPLPYGERGRKNRDRSYAISRRRRSRDFELVLRLRVEVAGVVPFVQLIRGIAVHPVDPCGRASPRASADHRHPAPQILVVLHRREFATAISGHPVRARSTEHRGIVHQDITRAEVRHVSAAPECAFNPTRSTTSRSPSDRRQARCRSEHLGR